MNPLSSERSVLSRARASYSNPRLENNGENYLTHDHIEELRQSSEIVWWDEYKETETVPGVGRLRRIGIQTAQGYTYDTLVGIPEEQKSPIPVIGTTAWTTSLRGHNERTVRNLVRNGNYVFFVGAENSYVTNEPQEIESPISLANSAAAVLNFSHHMGLELRQEGHDIDPELRFVLGESRGGMVAEGVDALAEHFAQHILFSDQIAPSLPEKLKTITDAYRLGEQILKEPVEMYRLLGSLTMARLKYYPHTLDIRSNCLKTQVVIGGALFSGETGFLSTHAPGNTLKHITVFENDFASNRHWWENRYADNPMVRITPLRGGHMTIADLETLQYVLARNKAAQEFIEQGSPLDCSLFERSHELVTRQYPITAEAMNQYARHKISC